MHHIYFQGRIACQLIYDRPLPITTKESQCNILQGIMSHKMVHSYCTVVKVNVDREELYESDGPGYRIYSPHVTQVIVQHGII